MVKDSKIIQMRSLSDPESVVQFRVVEHGAWILSNEPNPKLYCSVCDETPINEVIMNGYEVFKLDIKEQMKYCPKCGATMQ